VKRKAFYVKMSQLTTMKCPDCGKELNEKNVCIQCGKKAESPTEDIEVRYKEFPKSEFLEILAKTLKPGADSPEVPAEGDLEKPKQADDINIKSAHPRKAKTAKLKVRKEKSEIDKRSLLFFLAGFLTAAGIVGLYFLLKYFF
jgi:DNA-directed RNA polymerase subunit RPC12/RpoP